MGGVGPLERERERESDTYVWCIYVYYRASAKEREGERERERQRERESTELYRYVAKHCFGCSLLRQTVIVLARLSAPGVLFGLVFRVWHSEVKNFLIEPEQLLVSVIESWF